MSRAKCDCGMFGPAHYDDCALVRDLRPGEAVLQWPRGEVTAMTIDHREYDAELKKCSKCGARKHRSQFNRKSSAPDGHQYYCRECDNAAFRNPRPGDVVPVAHPGSPESVVLGGTGFAKTAEPNPKDLIGVKKVPTLSVIPSAGLVHCGRAMENGSEKYGRMNWREHPVKATIYLDAAVRHLMAWADGEEDAQDSGVHHLGHVMACCAILLDAQEAGNMIDDRVPGPAADLLERFKKE